ncbi:Intron-binding protein aquarius [Operophtera brumata]|uniref:Intron-binding protein aquarius n=1 Tax=Operophtera brumata TaxID=104452 RepID=A0A0L7L2X3_OPEBR|nr:Intron-binding protein aquarius [Operophtera brumata]
MAESAEYRTKPSTRPMSSKKLKMKTDTAPPPTDKPKIPLPTLSQINADRITQLANQYWSPATKEHHLPYNAAIVESIYQAEILGSNFSVRRIMMLEFSQYLENYLWPYYAAGEASHAHMMSIIAMITEKFRERVPAWQASHAHMMSIIAMITEKFRERVPTWQVCALTILI